MGVGQHGLWQSHHLAVRLVGRQDIGSNGPDVFRQRHHQFLTNGVDGGVCHLGKLLAEVVEQQLRAVAHHSERRVVTHRCNGFLTCRCHRHNGFFYIFLTVAEGDESLFKIAYRIFYLATTLQFFQLHAVFAKPLTIGMRTRQLLLNLAIVVDFAFLRVDEQNLAGLQATL